MRRQMALSTTTETLVVRGKEPWCWHSTRARLDIDIDAVVEVEVEAEIEVDGGS